MFSLVVWALSRRQNVRTNRYQKHIVMHLTDIVLSAHVVTELCRLCHDRNPTTIQWLYDVEVERR